MMTHDQIYERLYPIWQNLPGSNAKVKLGGLLADLEAETLEPEPLAVGWVSSQQVTEFAEGKTRLLLTCADGSQGPRIDQPVTITARKP